MWIRCMYNKLYKKRNQQEIEVKELGFNTHLDT